MEILSQAESRQFSSFLDSVQSDDALVVGGVDVVLRPSPPRPTPIPTRSDPSQHRAGNGAAGQRQSRDYQPYPISNPHSNHRGIPFAPASYPSHPHPIVHSPATVPPPFSDFRRPPHPHPPPRSPSQDMLDRKAVQTRELEQWLKARVVPAHNRAAGGGGEGDGERGGGVGDGTYQASGIGGMLRSQAGGEGRPERSYSEERPPRLSDSHAGMDDTMARMREAELRAGFSGRGVSFNGQGGTSSSGRGTALSTSVPTAAVFQRPPPPPPTGTGTTAPSPIPHKAPKRRAPKASNTLPSPPAATATDDSLNPAPHPTPSNIPPSNFRPPPPPPPPSYSPTSALPSHAPSNRGESSSAPKPVLLSAAQKKANHIASEQKRRAAIRNGYDGLCRVVPTLRAAVDEFEARVRNAKRGRGGDAGGGGGKKRKAGGAAGVLMGGIEVGGEKIDGRAGPKSEAVVLGKTVEHVRALLRSRQELLDRLSNAYQHASEHFIPIVGGRWIWDEHWDERPADPMEEGDDEAGGGGEEADWSEDE